MAKLNRGRHEATLPREPGPVFETRTGIPPDFPPRAFQNHPHQPSLFKSFGRRQSRFLLAERIHPGILEAVRPAFGVGWPGSVATLRVPMGDSPAKKGFPAAAPFSGFQFAHREGARAKLGSRKKIQTKDHLGVRLRYGPGFFLYTHLLPERSLNPGTPRPRLSRNIGQEDPGEKRAALFPVDPAEKERLPSRMPDRPEINAPVKDSRATREGEPPEKTIPAGQQKGKVIGNRDSKRYHLQGMKYYNKVLAYHRVEFDSEEEAIQAGYHKARK